MTSLQGSRPRRIVILFAIGVILTTTVTLAYAFGGSPSPHVVQMIIDYGDGVEKHFTALAWDKGMTVRDALHAAEDRPHGIKVQIDNDTNGPSAFLKQIDDLRNQRGGSGKKNWQYWVNTTYAKKGMGVSVLEPSDVVLWKFEEYNSKG